MQEVLDEFPEERVRLREIMEKRAVANQQMEVKSSKFLATKSRPGHAWANPKGRSGGVFGPFSGARGGKVAWRRSVNKFLKVVSARRTSGTASEDSVVPKVEPETILEQPRRRG